MQRDLVENFTLQRPSHVSLLLTLAGCFVGTWICSDALLDIAHVAATESEASHIWMVPIVFVWLFWMRRARIVLIPDGGSWLGTGFVVIGVLLWWFGFDRQIQAFWHLGAVLVVAGVILFAAGDGLFWKFLPAWGALLFLVPVPGRLRFIVAQPLEKAAAIATQSICEVFGLAVGRSGNQLSVNGVDVCIAEACNGMRLIFTLLLSCYVAMFIRPYKPWVRIVTLAASPIVALLANVFRLVPTLWVYAHFSASTAESFHDSAGAVMVLASFLMLTSVWAVLQWIGLPILSYDRPVQRTFSPSRTSPVAMGLLLATFCAGAARWVTLPRPGDATEYQRNVQKVAAAIPLSQGDWSCTDIPLPQSSLDELKTNVAISRHYQNRVTGHSLDLIILQSSDLRDLVPHYPPVCYPGQGLILTATSTITLRWPETTATARRYSFEWHDFRRGDPTIVDNFMVLPTGNTQPDTAGMERQIGSVHRYFGCAQVQVIYHDALPPLEQTADTESVLKAYLPLLRVIEAGKNIL